MSERILITGSRDWTNHRYIATVLRIVREFHPDAVLVHGDCSGADRLSAALWQRWGLPTEAHPVDWYSSCDHTCRHGRRRGRDIDYCPNAGMRRNRHMVALGADLCLAFLLPTSRGGASTAQLADQVGITTHRFPKGVKP
ncbi:DUF2493 domain-containing protein [Lentzea nigeriaca]|uniref:DUF2493 domain-containing protein n=1 Tax=Lentzea nigeriaca TaxID=1128665 RepID=UPI00195C482E|nr:DUF2493 domain-containing protein [Lentzea nigeriaca]MBM7861907.1 hypothetical protein [Lentzea nigeriaca]